MRIKIIGFLLMVLCYCVAFAASETAVKLEEVENDPISIYDEGSKLEILEKEIQSLIGRIELLERNFASLERSVLAKGPIEEYDGGKVSAQTMPDSDKSDIFELPHAATAAQPTKQKKALLHGEIEADKSAYDLALATLKDNKLEQAEEKFMNFIKAYPQSNLLGNAYFWYAESFFRRNIFDKAAINYLKGYKQFPKGPKAPDALLKLALSLEKLNKKREACNILSKLEAEFSNRSGESIKKAKDAKVKFGCKM